MARYTEEEKKKRSKKTKSTKVAQLKDLGGGVLANPSMEKTLKKLGISPADLLKIKSSGMGDHYNWKGKKI